MKIDSAAPADVSGSHDWEYEDKIILNSISAGVRPCRQNGLCTLDRSVACVWLEQEDACQVSLPGEIFRAHIEGPKGGIRGGRRVEDTAYCVLSSPGVTPRRFSKCGHLCNLHTQILHMKTPAMADTPHAP